MWVCPRCGAMNLPRDWPVCTWCRGEKKVQPPMPPPKGYCPMCRRKVVQPRHGHKRVYCSESCRTAGWRKRHPELLRAQSDRHRQRHPGQAAYFMRLSRARRRARKATM